MTQPVTPELRGWLVSQLAAGHSVAALRQSMRAAGWQDAATEAALSEIERGAGPLVPPMSIAAPIEVRAMPGPDLEGAPLYLDAGDRRVHVLHTVTNPRIVVFGDLLADDECEALVAAAGQRLVADRTPVVINLASQEYFKAVDQQVLKARVVECVFQEWKGGQYKIVSFYAKRARGLMARWAALHKAATPKSLEKFDLEGYAFDAAASLPERLVFRRRTA